MTDLPMSRRAAAIGRRLGRDLTPAELAYAQPYLTMSRRFRVAGVITGVAIELFRSVPDDRATVTVAGVLGGWLAGAFLAELIWAGRRPGVAYEAVQVRVAKTDNAAVRVPAASGTGTVMSEPVVATAADPDPVGFTGERGLLVPRWVRLLPLLLLLASVAATLFYRAIYPYHAVDADLTDFTFRGLLAGGTAFVTVFATARVQSVRRADAALADVDHEIRARAIAGITAGGTVLGIAFLLMPLGTLQQTYIGPAAVACGVCAIVGAVAAVLLGLIIRIARSRPVDPGSVRPGVLALTVALAAAATIGLTAERAHREDRAPYGPAAVGAHARLRFTDDAHAAATEAALGIAGRLNVPYPGDGFTGFAGRVDLTVPRGAPVDSEYYLIMIDKRTNTAVPWLSTKDGSGWDGFLGQVPRQYPWLSAIADQQVNGGWMNNAQAIYADPRDARPLGFTGAMRTDGTVTLDDLDLVMLFVGPQQQVYWATHVPLTG